MIQATAKADSLPPELRKHWEDAIAEKFPMTKEEACAYINNRYGSKASASISGDQVTVRRYKEIEVPEGAVPPSSYSSYMERPERRMRVYQQIEYLYIDNFKKSVIDEALKEDRP